MLKDHGQVMILSPVGRRRAGAAMSGAPAPQDRHTALAATVAALRASIAALGRCRWSAAVWYPSAKFV
jgi:hypothetical protein